MLFGKSAESGQNGLSGGEPYYAVVWKEKTPYHYVAESASTAFLFLSSPGTEDGRET